MILRSPENFDKIYEYCKKTVIRYWRFCQKCSYDNVVGRSIICIKSHLKNTIVQKWKGYEQICTTREKVTHFICHPCWEELCHWLFSICWSLNHLWHMHKAWLRDVSEWALHSEICCIFNIVDVAITFLFLF